MTNNSIETQTIDKYDRLYGGLLDVSLSTKLTTIKNTEVLTGRTRTFVVQTLRNPEMGDYIFVECLDETGLTRLALPPKVADAIASQREALTKRRRSIASKTTMANRMAGGWKPSFKKRAKR